MADASPYEGIGPRIRQARNDAGMTAEVMAPKVGVTMGTLLRWERGHTQNMSLARLGRVAEVTGRSVGWFLGVAAA